MLYTAISIFETCSDSPSYESLYSEEISVVEANSEEEARERAIAQGKASEHSYKNQYDETINVKFKAVIDVQAPLDEVALSAEGTIIRPSFSGLQRLRSF